MPYAHPEALVSTEWLAEHLGDPHVRVLDASYKQPGITPTAREDYDRGHIPGAVFFDIDDVAQPGTSLPHMIPSPDRFAEKMAARGIGNGDRVVVYDAVGLSSAGRAWWLLRLFGHDYAPHLEGNAGQRCNKLAGSRDRHCDESRQSRAKANAPARHSRTLPVAPAVVLLRFLPAGAKPANLIFPERPSVDREWARHPAQVQSSAE